MYYIGVDLGGTNIAAGIVKPDGGLVAKKSVKTQSELGFEPMMKNMSGCIAALLCERNLPLDEIAGIGIGSPGSIDSRGGVVIYANNLRLDNAPMAARLRKSFDKPVFISNDANCAALGESVAGGAKGVANVVLITLGTGVGGGVIIGGRIFDGSNGTGAELGHVVIHTGGELCTCGRRGCWEAYASATALIRQTKEAIRLHPDSLMSQDAEVSGRTAFEAMKKGDRYGKEVVDRYLTYIAEGVVNMINIFRPEVVLLGGGISHEGAYILEPIQRFIDRYSYAAPRVRPPRIRLATLGNDAGIIGAAMLCRN